MRMKLAPLRPGISQSRMTTSGACSRISCRPVGPSCASQILRAPMPSSIVRTTLRMYCSSSTSRMRALAKRDAASPSIVGPVR